MSTASPLAPLRSPPAGTTRPIRRIFDGVSQVELCYSNSPATDVILDAQSPAETSSLTECPSLTPSERHVVEELHKSLHKPRLTGSLTPSERNIFQECHKSLAVGPKRRHDARPNHRYGHDTDWPKDEPPSAGLYTPRSPRSPKSQIYSDQHDSRSSSRGHSESREIWINRPLTSHTSSCTNLECYSKSSEETESSSGPSESLETKPKEFWQPASTSRSDSHLQLKDQPVKVQWAFLKGDRQASASPCSSFESDNSSTTASTRSSCQSSCTIIKKRPSVTKASVKDTQKQEMSIGNLDSGYFGKTKIQTVPEAAAKGLILGGTELIQGSSRDHSQDVPVRYTSLSRYAEKCSMASTPSRQPSDSSLKTSENDYSMDETSRSLAQVVLNQAARTELYSEREEPSKSPAENSSSRTSEEETPEDCSPEESTASIKSSAHMPPNVLGINSEVFLDAEKAFVGFKQHLTELTERIPSGGLTKLNRNKTWTIASCLELPRKCTSDLTIKSSKAFQDNDDSLKNLADTMREMIGEMKIQKVKQEPPEKQDFGCGFAPEMLDKSCSPSDDMLRKNVATSTEFPEKGLISVECQTCELLMVQPKVEERKIPILLDAHAQTDDSAIFNVLPTIDTRRVTEVYRDVDDRRYRHQLERHQHESHSPGHRHHRHHSRKHRRSTTRKRWDSVVYNPELNFGGLWYPMSMLAIAVMVPLIGFAVRNKE